MNLQTRLCVICMACGVVLLFIHFALHGHDGHHPSKHLPDHIDHSHLLQIIKSQNATIYALEQALDTQAAAKPQIEKAPETVTKSQRQPEPIHIQPNLPYTSSLSNYKASLSTFESECEARYGMPLVDKWSQSREVWCSNEHKEKDTSKRSELICYPYLQEHKKRDGRGRDLFCEATNFVIDFSKVRSSTVLNHKPSGDAQYLSFMTGSLQSSCKANSNFKPNLFMPHHSRQMRSFQNDVTIQEKDIDSVVEHNVYLLARDEDCENTFHSTADFMNMLLVYTALGLDPFDTQVILFDNHIDGPYLDLISQAYSPKHNVVRAHHFENKKVMFKRLIFHLESPAGLIFPKVANPDPMRCTKSSFFDAYRRFVLNSFNLLDVPAPAIPSLTLSLRHRTERKNVGRVLGNEQEIIDVMKEGNMLDYKVIDGGTMSFKEQLTIIRHTNVLIGVHGAGLMLVMFAAEECVLIEMHPSYRQDRHFRHAARLTGKIYMPLRSRKRETCVGSSDTVFIDVNEFRNTLDGAVRLARNFDDGLSECGLKCPYEILAIDKRLDKYYKNSERKTNPLELSFPCY